MIAAHSESPHLQLINVAKHYGAVRAVEHVDLTLAKGSFTALVGASGSGKSTLLKMINRLVEPSNGTVLLEGENVADLPAPALRRRIGYVFQGIGLFPHMDVGQNVGVGPRIAGAKASPERIAELLDLVELDASYVSRMPHELSGGQRQRVGVARALAGSGAEGATAGPQTLLMDEPFGALDPITRDALGQSVRTLHDRLGLTTLMVTHDMAEALLLADRVIVLDAGQIAADAVPKELLTGGGGTQAQALVAVPRDQAQRLADLTR